MNNFRKTVHMQRLEVAKLAERLEVLSNETTEKPSFDALYAVRQEHDTVRHCIALQQH